MTENWPTRLIELKDEVIIGRALRNEVTQRVALMNTAYFNERMLSAEHARLSRTSDGFELWDSGSQHGVVFKGKLLPVGVHVKVSPGEVFGLVLDDKKLRKLKSVPQGADTPQERWTDADVAHCRVRLQFEVKSGDFISLQRLERENKSMIDYLLNAEKEETVAETVAETAEISEEESKDGELGSSDHSLFDELEQEAEVASGFEHMFFGEEGEFSHEEEEQEELKEENEVAEEEGEDVFSESFIFSKDGGEGNEEDQEEATSFEEPAVAEKESVSVCIVAEDEEVNRAGEAKKEVPDALPEEYTSDSSYVLSASEYLTSCGNSASPASSIEQDRQMVVKLNLKKRRFEEDEEGEEENDTEKPRKKAKAEKKGHPMLKGFGIGFVLGSVGTVSALVALARALEA